MTWRCGRHTVVAASPWLGLGDLVERPRGDTTLAPLADVPTARGLRDVLVDLAPAT